MQKVFSSLFSINQIVLNMQSFNVVTRSNANVVACSPSNLLGQQAFILYISCEI